MNAIDSVSPAFSHRPQPQRVAHEPRNVEGPKNDETKTAKNDAEPQANGVLRLLEEGHFKGVADVRLRINFHEQLNALQTQAHSETTQDAVSNLSQSITGIVEQQAGVPEDVTGAINGFQETLTQLSDTAADASALTEGVTAAFNDLAVSLRSILGLNDLAPTDQTADAAIETQSVVQQPNGFDAKNFLASLETIFADFQAMSSPVAESHTFTPPNGNGVAFDKFVAMYEELTATRKQENAESLETSVDQIV